MKIQCLSVNQIVMCAVLLKGAKGTIIKFFMSPYIYVLCYTEASTVRTPRDLFLQALNKIGSSGV